ncbi:unnamed protein product [Phytomonas sp. EM1]|nr:unnamed protein product [Phytomonas sp. EM1]|eukprot:CCW63701.1 unnamed protein product [Phytomonas sp. isolate EM1]
MKRTPCLIFLRHLRFLLVRAPKNPPLEGAILERFDKEAEECGFSRRDSIDDMIFMDKTFHAPTKIDGVSIAGLPSEPKCGKEFDAYRGSTVDFISDVVPYESPRKPSIRGGFGVREDKRLGFLRPRKSLPNFSQDDKLTPLGDENDMSVDNHLTQKQLTKKRIEFMKSFQGSVVSQRQHFLLADLDFEKDSILFGNTREEFERNVGLLKKAILTYTKWERTDNLYYYATLFLKILTAWIAMECLQQYYELHQLAANLETFIAVSNAEVERLEEARRHDLECVAMQLQYDKPDFSALVAAIRAEKRRMNAAETQVPLPSKAQDESACFNECTPSCLSISKGNDSAGSVGRTAGAAGQAREQDESLVQEVKYPPEKSHRVERFHSLRAIWRRFLGVGDFGSEPLSRDDFVRYSYVANPTSIEALRGIRRKLLPRSEDYTQIVREEMLQYKRDKERHIVLEP